MIRKGTDKPVEMTHTTDRLPKEAVRGVKLIQACRDLNCETRSERHQFQYLLYKITIDVLFNISKFWQRVSVKWFDQN